MEYIERMNRVLEAVERHLGEDALGDEEIARLAAGNAAAFRADFSRLTGISFAEYVRRRRLSCAAQDLLNTDITVTEAALRYGYSTPDAFSAAFRRLHGVSPSAARRGEGKLAFCCRMQLRMAVEGVDRMEYSIAKRSGFRVVGVRRTTPWGGGTWGIIKTDGSQERMRQELGCVMELGLCFGFGEDGSNDYMCAAQYPGEAPGWDEFTYPEAMWLTFEAKGRISENVLGLMWKRIHGEFLPQSRYRIADLPTIEKYAQWDEEQDLCRVEIHLPVVDASSRKENA